ncbi:Putative esterase [Saliniradius amylolyticus]|uniref:Esterase n=1 Tax=Saliniradius amylolyticus TaxID=2183582 RepID=A0A2S2E010_9ALTE|nr:hydrolase [Saliniradius amylolyticus]AWL10610.1 Putative esterase [Saliniradius amylolyticus]
MTQPEPEYGQIKQSDFYPPWWARNRHVQTIFPRFFQRRRQVALEWQNLDLPDNDFVELAWTPKPDDNAPLVVCFHGLEGSAKSHYANDMLANLFEQGWQAVMMHFRGCGRQLNRTARAYHSGDTQDALFLLDWLRKRFPSRPLAAMGFSLGANMLLKLLGENPNSSGIRAAVAISPPFKLAECGEAIQSGFSRLYQRYLIRSMCERTMARMRSVDHGDKLTLRDREIMGLKTFRDFDQRVTAPLHGFSSADDYYRQCSSVSYLKRIKQPTLILHSKDDPFMSPSVVPKVEDLSPAVTLELSEKGGHVGFMQGVPWRPQIWLHERVAAFFRPYLDSVTSA